MLLTFKPPLHEGISPPNVNGRPSWMSTHQTGAPSFATQSKPTSAPPPRPASVLPSQAPSPASNGQLMNASHRNPPSASANLPAPERTTQTVPISSASSIPPPPAHWQNTDESMRQWLSSRAEEDRRRQEEERTRQESLKLDQRKVEQTMLRDSLQAGVPPYMVPFIFASLGGGNLQWAQQYITHMSQLQSPNQGIPQHQTQPQPQQPLSGEIPKDNRSIPPNPYATQPFATAQQKQQSPSQTPYVRAGSASLSRITNGEVQIHHNPGNTNTAATAGVGPIVAQTQTQRMAPSPKKDGQDQNQQASSIHFHHWVPPNQSQSNTPTAKTPNTSPNTTVPHSHLRSEYQNSPKKRKAQGGHQQAPPPPSQLSEPTSSRARAQTDAGRRATAHARNRSDTSLPNEQTQGVTSGRHGEPGVIIWQSQKPEPAVDPKAARWYDNNASSRPVFDGDGRFVRTQDGNPVRRPPDPPSRTVSSSSAGGSLYLESYHPGHKSTTSQASRPMDPHSTMEERRSRSPSNVALAGMNYDRIRSVPSR